MPYRRGAKDERHKDESDRQQLHQHFSLALHAIRILVTSPLAVLLERLQPAAPRPCTRAHASTHTQWVKASSGTWSRDTCATYVVRIHVSVQGSCPMRAHRVRYACARVCVSASCLPCVRGRVCWAGAFACESARLPPTERRDVRPLRRARLFAFGLIAVGRLPVAQTC